MRILFLAPQPFFEVRGTPLAVLHMLKALAALGHSVDLLTLPQGRDEPVPGVRHLRSAALPVGRVRAGPSLPKLLLDVPFMAEAAWRMAFGRYDVVHAVEEAAHLAAPLARLLRLPLVMDVDSSIPDQLRGAGWRSFVWLAESLERRALERAAVVVTVCRSLTEGVRERAPHVPVFQVEDPPLVDGAESPAPHAVAALRHELRLGEGPVVLYSGNFEPYQGVELLVDASCLLPEVQFVFMGGEPEQIARLAERQARAGGRCAFAGKRPPAELPLFLALADVVASPRRQGENTPFKVFTYLASGKPLVATAIATHTQLLDASVCFLAEPTAAGLAEAMRQALARPDEARARAERGRALVAREYSAVRYADKVAAAYAAVERAVSR